MFACPKVKALKELIAKGRVLKAPTPKFDNVLHVIPNTKIFIPNK